MRANTTDFISQLTEAVNEILPTYYEEAPVTGPFPYAVTGGINIVSLSEGDLASFSVDFYGDEKNPAAAVELAVSPLSKWRNSVRTSFCRGATRLMPNR